MMLLVFVRNAIITENVVIFRFETNLRQGKRMKLIEKFRTEVLNSQDSFVITESGESGYKTRYFVQGNVGEARYVYGCYGYNSANFYSDINKKLDFIAIVRDNKIYIYDEFFFNLWQHNNKIQLPGNVYMFTDILKSANNYVRNVIFPKFYSGLEISDDVKINLNYCIVSARRIIFSGADSTENTGVPEYHDIFNEQDIASILCGFIDFGKESVKRLLEEKKQWINEKATDTKIQELIENPETVLSWEKAIADGLRGINAKTVLAEFEMGGKKSAAKICPDTIINKMAGNGYFDYYNFLTDKKGKELLEELGIDDKTGDKKYLTCKDIRKIVYRGKALYVRES